MSSRHVVPEATGLPLLIIHQPPHTPPRCMPSRQHSLRSRSSLSTSGLSLFGINQRWRIITPMGEVTTCRGRSLSYQPVPTKEAVITCSQPAADPPPQNLVVARLFKQPEVYKPPPSGQHSLTLAFVPNQQLGPATSSIWRRSVRARPLEACCICSRSQPAAPPPPS